MQFVNRIFKLYANKFGTIQYKGKKITDDW